MGDPVRVLTCPIKQCVLGDMPNAEVLLRDQWSTASLLEVRGDVNRWDYKGLSGVR